LGHRESAHRPLRSLRLTPAKKEAHEKAGEDELSLRRDATTALPAVEAVAGKELAAARTREPDDVLDIRRRSGQAAGDGRIERPARGDEKEDSGDPGADLEAAVRDVLVRHPVAREVEQQSELQRQERRAD
jgi:hypothetical protein